MEQKLKQYLDSPAYQEDMAATRDLWTRPGVLGEAGMFIFLSYITIPELVVVQPVAGFSRSATLSIGLAHEHEKRFLQRVLGLSEEVGWKGGISNVRIRTMISNLAQQHLQFRGMCQEYMDFFAGIIALSVLRVYSTNNTFIDESTRTRYWRYMDHTCLLLGVTLYEETTTQQRCQDFIDTRTQPTLQGKMMLNTLREVYPEYIDQAMTILVATTHQAVKQLLEDLHV